MSIIRQPHCNVAGIVLIVDIDELDRLAADMERHAVGETHDSVERFYPLERRGSLGKALLPGLDLIVLHPGPVLDDAILDNDRRRRGEQRCSARMVAVVLRDDNVTDRLRRDRLYVFEQNPRLWRIVAGVDQDDALRRHDHHGVGVVAFADKGVDAIGELLQLGLVTRHGQRRYRRKHQDERNEQTNPFHDRAPSVENMRRRIASVSGCE